MIEEKVKQDSELEKLNKTNRENLAKITNLKKELESSEEKLKKREIQFESLIFKIKSQEQELLLIKNELRKKHALVQQSSNELNDLRPMKEVKVSYDKQSKIIEDLKKNMNIKESEIGILKGIIKTLKISNNNEGIRSPGKLPPIKAAKTAVSKYSLSSKSAFTMKTNLMNEAVKAEDDHESYLSGGLFVQDSENKGKNIEEDEDKENERIKAEEAEKERLENEEKERKQKEDERIRKEEEDKRIEEERILKERETEEIERKLMEIEEKIRKEEDQRLLEEQERLKKEEQDRLQQEEQERLQLEEEERLRKEEQDRQEEQKKKKASEDAKKGKGKQPVKPSAKTGVKKK